MRCRCGICGPSAEPEPPLGEGEEVGDDLGRRGPPTASQLGNKDATAKAGCGKVPAFTSPLAV